jgi:hypothetical protein
MWSLIIVEAYGGSNNVAIQFPAEAEARAWAAKYMEGFRGTTVFLVNGTAVKLERPESRP